MATTQLCDLCERRDSGIPKVASEWCSHCEDALCSDCLEHHNVSRSSTGHKTIPLNNFRELPPFILEIKRECMKHDSKFEYYCSKHNTPICVYCCRESHMNCSDVKNLNEYVKNIKESESLSKLEQSLINIAGFIEKAIQDEKNKVLNFEDHKLKIMADIRQQRQLLNEHLDQLENKLIAEINTKTNEYKVKTETSVAYLEMLKKNIDEIGDDMTKMKESANNFQLLIGIRIIEEKILQEGKDLISLKERGELYQLSLSVNISDKLNTFINEVDSFGQITECVVDCSNDLDINLFDVKQSQVQVRETNVKALEKIHLVEHRKIKLKKLCRYDFALSGCEILPDGKLLFVDMNNKVLLSCKNDGKKHQKIFEFRQTPCDVTSLNDKEIAITVSDNETFQDHSIMILDIKSKKEMRSLQTPSFCTGIECQRNTQMTIIGEILNIQNLTNQVETEIKLPSQDIFYISCHNDAIYCTHEKTNTVFCINMTGKLVWRFKHECLQGPQGVATDNEGFIYVAGKESNNVVVISPDGKGSRILISDFVRPKALCVNKSRGQMLVCNEFNHTVVLYNITSV